MPLFENRIFRLGLLLITVVVAYLWLRGFGTEETTSQSREDAAAEEIVETPTFEPQPEASPVVIEPVDVPEPIDGAEDPLAVLWYTIESGDRLDTIAVKFNTSPDAIMLANPGLDPSRLIAGEEIRLIGATTDPSAGGNPSTDRDEGLEVTYFVESGDNLGSIADKYRVSLDALFEANPGVDASAIIPGQQLTIPPLGTGIPAEVLTPQPTVEVIQRELGESATHEVTSGDSLTYLASIYETSVAAILAANPGVEEDSIQIGQLLNIPPPQR